MSPALRTAGGATLDCRAERWFAPACRTDQRLLHRAVGPVLDVGCGPGRHLIALAERGIPALGIDITPDALRVARSRGADVLHRNVFDPLPGTGRWPTILLLDGNVGIGGDPVLLLQRVAELLAPTGQVLVELSAPGESAPPEQVRFHIEADDSPFFPFARLGADVLPAVATAAGLCTADLWPEGGRWFGRLVRRAGDDNGR